MRVPLVEIAEPVIEALPVRDAGAVGLAEAPLADYPGGVAGLFQQLGDGYIRRPKRHAGVAADQRVARMQAGHQAAARRSADRASGVVIGEAHPLGGKLIDIRRFDCLLPVAAQVAVAQIVGQNENNIGRIFYSPRRPAGSGTARQQAGRPRRSRRNTHQFYEFSPGLFAHNHSP